MRVLALPRYGRLGASSRLRFIHYLPCLEEAGIKVTLSPLFSDNYVSELQLNRRNRNEVARSYLRRLMVLLRNRKFDLLWIEKELLPWLPGWCEQVLLSARVPYVLDYDDAIFHYYDQHRNSIVRLLLEGKHPALIRNAVLVLAGNDYLADFACSAGARRVEVLPTSVDLERYRLTLKDSPADNSGVPYVGWIGQRSTAEFLRPLAPIFERLTVARKGRFCAIGIDTSALGLPMESIAWSEQSEVETLRSFDVGIMPLVDKPFERGKCGYKLIQYMACRLPVVASPVGVNRQIVEHGVNGFLAETPEQWETALSALLADAGLRQRMGQAGREKVERQFCVQVTGQKLVELLIGALNTSARWKN